MKTIFKKGSIDHAILCRQLTDALGAPGSPQKWYFNGAQGEVTVFYDDPIADASVQAVLDAHDPLAPAAADVRAAMSIDAVDRLQFDLLFQHENSIRALRALINTLVPGSFTAPQAAQITVAQYRAALINRWKALNP